MAAIADEDEEHAVQMQDFVAIRMPRRVIATIDVDARTLRKKQPAFIDYPEDKKDLDAMVAHSVRECEEFAVRVFGIPPCVLCETVNNEN